jgi:hypothetical protein
MLPLIFLANVAKYLAKSGKFVAIALAFILWLVDFIEVVITATIQQVVAAFQSLDLSTFSNVSLVAIDYIAYANAVLPISEFVVLFVAYMTAWLTVVIIRWIKSFVPTLAN